mmetsp:Transcript_21697/g.38320  ORF Transcript_21697/g.38320 Transcript_21697/m.38320 type:complete len:741 (-) Transcript_21697:24-2246(-)|eukprot:CAMPEP_0184551216 /NCGR_PEP_ID=MMETSP0199_2-20130426/24039_1 /TAXON_ID=1112570 /ORGANISM="Thraustochytrium sp., Strain LLF1b" /LENGTH=740 /DNA_ID=CAMNT_0026946311 /DNA_START=180 /DNA_END=2402 /DNA_ORIENTATION=+
MGDGDSEVVLGKHSREGIENGEKASAGELAKKRRRTFVQLERTPDARAERIRKLLTVVGQGVSKSSKEELLEAQLVGLHKVISQDLEDPKYGVVFEEALIECACGFGRKAPVYAAFIALLPEALQERVVSAAEAKLSAALQGQGEFVMQEVVVTRLLCELANCKVVAQTSIVKLLQSLIDLNHEVTVLRAFPWLIADGENELTMMAKAAIEKLKLDDNSAFQQEQDAATAILAGENDLIPELFCGPYKRETLKKLFSRLSNPIELAPVELKVSNVKQPCLLADDSLFVKAGKMFNECQQVGDEDKKDKVACQLAQTSSEKNNVGLASKQVELIKPHACWLVRVFVHEILASYDPFVDEACAAIIELTEGHDLEYVVFDCVLSALTSVWSRHLFFERVAIALIKSWSSKGEVIVGDTIEAIMLLGPDMARPKRDLLVNWFSQYLLLGPRQLSWDRWAFLASVEKNDPRRQLLEQLLERLSELYALQSVSRVVPSSMLDLLPKARGPESRFLEERAPTCKSLEEALQFLRTKPEAEEIIDWFSKASEGMAKEEQLEYAMHAALFAGQPSFTHTSKALEKMKVYFERIAPSKEERGPTFVSAALSFWASNWQWSRFVLVHLVHLGLVEGRAVCTHVVENDLLDKWQVFPLLLSLLESPGPALERNEELKALEAMPKVGAFGAALSNEAEVREANARAKAEAQECFKQQDEKVKVELQALLKEALSKSESNTAVYQRLQVLCDI